MSRTKLIKDNLIILIGGNIGNIFSFLTNFILLAVDKRLANLYVAYNSIVLILGVPALVAMRMFTIYGDTIILKLRKIYSKGTNLLGFIVLGILLLTIPLGYFITLSTEDGNIITSALIIILALLTFVVYCFRGIKQFEENFIPTVISLNIETLGRTILVLVLGVWLGWGIYGVFLGAIISMALAIIPCFEYNYLFGGKHDVSDYRLIHAFANSFILTAGTEFFSNFDVAYSLKVLENNDQAQTEYTTLQLFRKMIFYGLFFSSGLFLSLGNKAKFTKKFTFLYTLGVSLGFGGLGALIIYLLRNIFLQILRTNFIILDNDDVAYFMIFTALMSSAYILSNWLLASKRKLYIYIPGLASILQVLIFVFSQHNIHSLIISFSITSGIFFTLSVVAGIYEVFIRKGKND